MTIGQIVQYISAGIHYITSLEYDTVSHETSMAPSNVTHKIPIGWKIVSTLFTWLQAELFYVDI